MPNLAIADIHLQKIIQKHFDPINGSKYWIEKAEQLNFSPVKEINSLDDIYKFGFSSKEDVLNIPSTDLVPKSVDLNACKFVSTGCTELGKGNLIPWSENSLNSDALFVANQLSNLGFPQNSNWLHVGASGPHPGRWSIPKIVDKLKGIYLTIDFDLRWFNLTTSQDQYLDHIYDQIFDLQSRYNIEVLMIPSFMKNLIRNFEKLKGIVLFGSYISIDDYNKIKEYSELDSVVCMYGNTWNGISLQFVDSPNLYSEICYYPNWPQNILEVRKKTDWSKKTQEHERGLILFHCLREEFFWPNMIERDEAFPAKSIGLYANGVAGVKRQ